MATIQTLLEDIKNLEIKEGKKLMPISESALDINKSVKDLRDLKFYDQE